MTLVVWYQHKLAVSSLFSARHHMVLPARLSVWLPVRHTNGSVKTVEVKVTQFSPYSSPSLYF